MLLWATASLKHTFKRIWKRFWESKTVKWWSYCSLRMTLIKMIKQLILCSPEIRNHPWLIIYLCRYKLEKCAKNEIVWLLQPDNHFRGLMRVRPIRPIRIATCTIEAGATLWPTMRSGMFLHDTNSHAVVIGYCVPCGVERCIRVWSAMVT